MVIKCISTKPNLLQLELLPKRYSNSDFHITESKEYLVLGLTMEISPSGNQTCFVEILSDYNHLTHSPLFLFEIVDSRVSKYWKLKIFEDGQIVFWPEQFFQEFFHDDLSEDVPEIVGDFIFVKNLLEEEQLLRTNF